MNTQSVWDRAKSLLVGGVNSPIRARVRPRPFFTAEGKGAYIKTLDGRTLLDYVLGYGPLILGHRHPRVEEAIRRQASRGWLYGTPHEGELELAEAILKHAWPGGRLRLTNSGTEAVATAVRLARAATGRTKLLVFKGSYHGAHDSLLHNPPHNLPAAGTPKPGLPRDCGGTVIFSRFNDDLMLKRVVEEWGEELAAAVVEPVMANHGLIPGSPNFLRELERLARVHGFLLVFDETVTGFRLALGGAQEYYGVRADIVTLGKVIGGGLPVGALAGDPNVMSLLAPEGPVFSAGTFSGNPLTMAAGIATLEALVEERALERASKAARLLEEGMIQLFDERGLEWSVRRVESMLQVYFTPQPPSHPDEHPGAFDELAYGLLHERMLMEGVFIPPSQMEVWFTSLAHDDENLVDKTLTSLEKSTGGTTHE